MNSPLTQIQRVSNWITNLEYEQIPFEVIHLAKLQLLDCLSAICAGERSSVGVRLKNSLKKTESGGDCTLIPSGEKWSLDNSMYYHAAMINSLELDHFLYMGHVGQSAVSSSIAVSELYDLDGKDFLLALVTADEVSGRMGAHLFSGPLQGHMRSFLHRSAAATSVSKLMKFNEKETSRALSIALSMPELPLYPACFSPDTKVICPCSPTVEGVKAAFMAQQSMEGPEDIIENPAGFLAYFSYLKKYPDIWRWIGQSWALYTLCVKKFATCGYAQGPSMAAIDIKKACLFRPEEISNIRICAPMSTVVMENFSKPHNGFITPVNTHFSTIRSVSAALINGELTGDFYRAGNFENMISQIVELSKRAELRHDWKMTINLVNKIDRGLINAGKFGFLSLRNSEKTLRRFREAFGSRSLFSINDLGEVAGIPLADQLYFIRRYLRAYGTGYQKRGLYDNAERAYSHEGDLRKMLFPMSGRVEVSLRNGKKIDNYCEIPAGYNPELREHTILSKYERETRSIWGKEKSSAIKNYVLDLQKFRIRDLMAEIRSID